MKIDNRFLGEQIELITKRWIITISKVPDGVRVGVIDRKKGTRKIMMLGEESDVAQEPLPWLTNTLPTVETKAGKKAKK